MNYDLKIYNILGLNTRHIETIDRVYGSMIDKDFSFEQQPRRVKEIIRHLAELPSALRPKFIFESAMLKPARRFKAFARGITRVKYKKTV